MAPEPPAGAADGWEAACGACGLRWPVEGFRWECTCGGLLELIAPPLDPVPAPSDAWSLWRYAAVLPPLAVRGAAAVSLGEGMTPLVDAGTPTGGDEPGPGALLCKLDFLQPTLSFKDRGAAVMVAAMLAAGVRSVVADSSGNAGTALAAYAGRAGIAAGVYVPEATSPAKRAAIAGFGAALRVVPGSRADAAAAARERLAGAARQAGAPVYASHVHQPMFVQGTKTCAYEIWEQLGCTAPATVVTAVGNGTMALGLRLGFAELEAAGRIGRSPAIVAVQAERCAPLLGLAPVGPTVAEGIAIAAPPRAAQILGAVRDTGGAVVGVGEQAILDARRDLAARGIDVEPTAAAVWAGWSALGAARRAACCEAGPAVLVLGGAGAKSPAR